MATKILISLLAIWTYSLSQLLVEIVYSSNTDINLKTTISSVIKEHFSMYVDQQEVFMDSEESFWNLSEESNVIIDLAFSHSISEFIKDYSYKHQIIHISPKKHSNSYSSWQYYTHPTNLDNLIAWSNLLSLLNWDKFTFIYDESEVDSIQFFKNQFIEKQPEFFFFGNQENQTFSDDFIGKVVKPTGIRNIAISSQGESASKLIKSLANKIMMKEGTGIILGSQSWWGVNENWILGFIESGLENATDYYSYEALACVKLMNLITKFPYNGDKWLLKEFLDKNTRSHHALPNFTIINTSNNAKRNVGAIIDGEISFYDELVFIGNSSFMPNSPKTSINVWLADGQTNPGGQDSLLNYITKAGSRFVFEYYLENTNFLEGFEFLITHTDCGAEIYSPEFNLNCFSNLKSTPGVAFLTNSLPFILFGNLRSFKTLNLTMPVISDYATPLALSNKEIYPQFMRISGYELYHTSVLTQLINIFEWKNVILILENTTDNAITYEYLVNWANKTKVNIANKEEDRWVMQNYMHSNFDSVKKWMKRIIDLKVRPIVYSVSPPFGFGLIIDFYEVGFRQGDCIFLTTSKLSAGGILDSETSKQRLVELLYGSLVIIEVEFDEEYGGQEIWKAVQAYSSKILKDVSCYSFDAAMLIAQGIKYTITRGEDYEDNFMLNANMRYQKFLGCSGPVSIESDSNNRKSPIIAICSIIWNETTGLTQEKQVGTYNVERTQLFTFTNNIIWWNNQTMIPDDMIVYDNGCSFDEKEIRFSSNGAAIFYAISVVILVLTIILTFYAWKWRWSREKIEPIKKSIVKFHDYILVIAVFVDALQLLSLSPDLGYDIVSSKVSYSVSINLGWLSKGDRLWILVNCAVIIVGIWVLFCIEIKFNFLSAVENFFISAVRTASYSSLTVIGNIGFLPIVSILFSSFACFESIGSSIKQTFVHKDCSMFCWQGSHIMWAVLSITSLIVYLPSAIYFRPYSDILNDGNIKTKPLFLMVKGILQISMIILSQTLKVYWASLYGLIYIFLLLMLIGFCIKLKPYNYGRLNLFQILLYVGVLWGVSISTIYSLSSYKYPPLWLTLNFIGWVILLGAGIVLKKYYPSMLYTEKRPNIGMLFKFELGGKISADDINLNKTQVNEEEEESCRDNAIPLGVDTREVNLFVTTAN